MRAIYCRGLGFFHKTDAVEKHTEPVNNVWVQFHIYASQVTDLQNLLDDLEHVTFFPTKFGLLLFWKILVVVFKKCFDCLSQSHIRQDESKKIDTVLNCTSCKTRTLSTISNVEDQHVSTSQRSWRSFCCRALSTSKKYCHQRDDA